MQEHLHLVTSERQGFRSLVNGLLPHRLPSDERDQLFKDVRQDAILSRRYVTLLTLSTVIASFGLLSNSAAVIIGAMIIAPLMGPIIGLSFGAITFDSDLQRRSLFAEVTGVLLAVAIGFLVGCIPFNFGVTAEMQARTSPTMYDLFIALASGLAGGYASANRRVNATIAGVAISVALVPPLASCGLLLALGHRDEALGAGLLFLANFFCIEAAASFVFFLYQLAPKNPLVPKFWPLVARFAPTVLALGLMAWFMTETLVKLTREHSLSTHIESVLSSEVTARTGGRLDQVLQEKQDGDQYLVVASVLTPQTFDTSQVAAMEQQLRKRVRPDIHLVIRSLISKDMDSTGQVYITDTEKEATQAEEKAARFLDLARRSVSEDLSGITGASLVDLERQRIEGADGVAAMVSAPEPIQPSQVRTMESHLQSAVSEPVRLVVRSLVTASSDSNGMLYQAQAAPKLSIDDQRLMDRLSKALTARMKAILGGQMIALQISHTVSNTLVRATVSAPATISPAQVSAFQADFRKYIDPTILLTIHTNVEGTAGPVGWQTD